MLICESLCGETHVFLIDGFFSPGSFVCFIIFQFSEAAVVYYYVVIVIIILVPVCIPMTQR